MENKVLVSVDMITYMHEAYITQAIEGVLMQETNFEYELIIADDCSPDNTEEVVRNIIATHPKGHIIKYFRHEKNMGMHANGDFALQKCHGKYIALCEGDDFWTDRLKLQKQVDFLENNREYSLCFHPVEFLHKHNIKTFSLKLSENIKNFTILDLAENNFIFTSSVVFKSDSFSMPVWMQYSPVGDYPMYMICAKNGLLAYLPHYMSVYRLNTGIWSTKSYKYQIINLIFALNLLIKNFYEDKNVVFKLESQKNKYLNDLYSKEELGKKILLVLKLKNYIKKLFL